MDIVTHCMMGVIGATPFLDSHPVAASLFALGCVLPDLDSLSRLFGKRAFLESHQTWSHALPVIAVLGGIAGLSLMVAGIDAPAAGLGLALGMALHSLLDVTNTYGIMLFAPFSRRRYCKEWVFFIDAFVIVASMAALAAIWLQWRRDGYPGAIAPAVYWAVMGSYWTAKMALRRRAAGSAPLGTLALLPSALVPWHYLGCAREGDGIHLFRMNALTRKISGNQRTRIHDEHWRPRVQALPEFQVMQELSPAYHVVRVEPHDSGTRLVCRDLRTRNFSTRFGELEIALDAAGTMKVKAFHV